VSELKSCVACGRTYPRTTDNFHRSKDGFHSRCRRCRNKEGRQKRQKKTNEKLDRIERGAVRLFTEAAAIGGAHIPHSSELIEVIMQYFGGVRGFGNAYLKQFYDAPPGGAFRTKMLDSIVRLVSANTAMGGAKKPLDLMSEEELESELRRQIMQAAMGIAQPNVIESQAVQALPVPPTAQEAPQEGEVAT